MVTVAGVQSLFSVLKGDDIKFTSRKMSMNSWNHFMCGVYMVQSSDFGENLQHPDTELTRVGA